MSSKQYKYNFSFVIPVYNVEEYLAETIESVLAQTMDFATNCELILVNDGSPDNSEEVCLRYQQQFPKNIKYIKQDNAGPGAARNRGIVEAQGKYISLLDSDDKLSPDTLEEVYKFIEKHHEEIDLVGIKWEFFEARTGSHPLNYKFTTDRIIDLNVEYENIQGSCAPAFFKQEVLKKHPFDPAVGRYSEDARLMGEILLENPRFGVVTKPTYFYRKRLDQASSQDGVFMSKFWYLETPKRVWYDLFDYARTHNKGKIPRFIQYMCAYDLQWRIKQASQTVLSHTEEVHYKQLIYGLLPDIDDEVIVSQRFMGPHRKVFLLDKKYGHSIKSETEKRGSKYYYNGTKIYDLGEQNPAVHLEFIERTDSGLLIEGFFNGVLLAGAKLQFRCGGKIHDTQPVRRSHRRMIFLDEEVWSGDGFQVEIPVKDSGYIEALISDETRKLPIITHRFSRLSQSAPLSYCIVDDLLIRKLPGKLAVNKYTNLRRIGYELVFWAALAKRLKLRITKQQYLAWRKLRSDGVKTSWRDLAWVLIPAKAAARNIVNIGFRLAYFVAKPFCRHPIWILSDRIMAADDSGEILFRYLKKRKDVRAKIYFTISKDSSEYSKLKQLGSVLSYGSLRYRLMFLLADKIISSEATEGILNAFGGRLGDVLDLCEFDFVFLQHGISRDDISKWVNRFNKNIKLFVTSAKPEQESILIESYGYNKNIVRLTGLARYDKLYNKPANKIIIAPTWREDLAGKVDGNTGNKMYSPSFKMSYYFTFWQDLMNDKRVKESMEKHGYSGEFYIHPSFQMQASDFAGNEYFKIMQMPHDYPKAKSEGSLLVTDYSSVAFDFAYLKKPVIYAQFDEDTYYTIGNHQRDYFSYESDGFGPVAYDYEATVMQILKSLKENCKMSAEYQDRVDGFFAFTDRNNSRRIYEAILEMDQKKNSL